MQYPLDSNDFKFDNGTFSGGIPILELQIGDFWLEKK
jgi:hypothetical protein